MFIANHTMYGALDVPFIISHIVQRRDVLIRGLAHPALFSSQGSNETDQDDAGSFNSSVSFIEKYGAVSVTPRNVFRLLRANEAVLLFPGGMREACKLKGEQHSLHWPNDPEFIRLARRFDAILVPVSCVGQDYNFKVILDAKDILGAPIIGQRIRQQMEAQPALAAQTWRGKEKSAQEAAGIIPPLSIPKAPRRLYFKFGVPIEVRKKAQEIEESRRYFNAENDEILDESGIDSMIYRFVKSQVQSGINEINRRRKADPYENPRSRFAYELAYQTQAPSAWNIGDRDGFWAE